MKNFYQVILVFVLISACSSQSADPDGKVSSDIKVILLEEISEEGKSLVIRSETFEIFSCYNYSIVSEQHFKDQDIQITYSGIIKPEICLTALGPAQSLEFFSLKNGIYNITFVNDGVQNEGKLTVDDEKYILKINDPRNVFVENGILNRS